MTDYLSALFDAPVTIHELASLGTEESENQIKGFGYGQPLLLGIERDSRREKFVFHTMAGDQFGHERPSERACNILLDFHTFNKLPLPSSGR